MPLLDPTSQNVVDFWKAMLTKYSTVQAEPLSVDELVVRHIDPNLCGCAVTIGNTIHTPYVPGTVHPDWNLFEQIVNCVHEHHHVWQDKRPGFRAEYNRNSTARAHAEAEAYRCNMLLHWRYRNVQLDVGKLAGKLWYYGCTTKDVSMAAQMLVLSFPAIRRGALPGPVCRFAVGLLDVML